MNPKTQDLAPFCKTEQLTTKQQQQKGKWWPWTDQIKEEINEEIKIHQTLLPPPPNKAFVAIIDPVKGKTMISNLATYL